MAGSRRSREGASASGASEDAESSGEVIGFDDDARSASRLACEVGETDARRLLPSRRVGAVVMAGILEQSAPSWTVARLPAWPSNCEHRRSIAPSMAEERPPRAALRVFIEA